MGGREAGVPAPLAPPGPSAAWLRQVPVGGSSSPSSTPLPTLRALGPPIPHAELERATRTSPGLHIVPCPHGTNGPFLNLSPNSPDGPRSQSPSRPLTKELAAHPRASALAGPRGGQGLRPGLHPLQS